MSKLQTPRSLLKTFLLLMVLCAQSSKAKDQTLLCTFEMTTMDGCLYYSWNYNYKTTKHSILIKEQLKIIIEKEIEKTAKSRYQNLKNKGHEILEEITPPIVQEAAPFFRWFYQYKPYSYGGIPQCREVSSLLFVEEETIKCSEVPEKPF